MPRGIVDKEALADEVAAALSDWTAAQAYEQESAFRDDLHAYLDARLNAGGGNILDTGGNFVVDRTDGDLECHIVVSNSIGIAVFRDLTASRTKRLHQQIQAYLKAYTHVIIIACGSTDDAAWENLRDSYEGALLNRHTALESCFHVLLDVVDETHQDNLSELSIPFTRSDGRAVRALDRGIRCFGH